ncbi:hypothetical protein [Pseudomonas aeruginosa]|uniref:hypothetical protein n=1 Tax=Pseudomonas aeruginosa TaxID=287 RepID=UPI0022EBA19F|nr:hypothetical protein [Pseudomonas aeruginosa]MDA3367411.1 hypothetical protein [Pseudomonas aeruginosa]
MFQHLDTVLVQSSEEQQAAAAERARGELARLVQAKRARATSANGREKRKSRASAQGFAQRRFAGML